MMMTPTRLTNPNNYVTSPSAQPSTSSTSMSSYSSLLISDVLFQCFPNNHELCRVVVHLFRKMALETVEDVVIKHTVNPHHLPSAITAAISNEPDAASFDVDAMLMGLCGLLIPPETDLQNNNNNRRLTTGCASIDAWLCGGWPRGQLCEISGEAGAGKTLLVLQSALHALKTGQATVVYFAVEPFPHDRVTSLHILPESLRDRALKNLVLWTSSDAAALHQALSMIPQIAEDSNSRGCPIAMVVLDSIAALRTANQETATLSASTAVPFAEHLKQLAASLNVPVLATNQVRSVEEHQSIPALGLTWANHVNTRLFIMRRSSNNIATTAGSRTIRVCFSNHLKSNVKMSVEITTKGMLGSDAVKVCST
eukprot:PhM_4_TR15316/c0_g1_i1/m.31762/K10880/XRCC3; DNA-repair protein XRCC3